MTKNNEKPISLDELAGMIKRGFDEAQEDRGQLRKETKDGFAEVKGDISHLQASLSRVQADIGEIKTQLTVIQRLERLEKQVFGEAVA